MGLFDKIFGPGTSDEKYYAIVSEEIASGQIRPGLWAIALANCEYDETKAKAIYLKMRVKIFKEELKEYENTIYAELNLANKQGDVKRTRELSLPLAQMGNAYGIYCYSHYLLIDAKNANDAEAAIRLLTSVAGKHSNAHFSIGRAFCYGTNHCQVNGDLAFRNFNAGARAHDIGCQYELGLMYLRGRNKGEARKWFRSAAALGHVEAGCELKLLD